MSARAKTKRQSKAEKRRLAIIQLADDTHGKEGHIEFDEDAKLSEGNDNGCYVQAWVWLDFDGTPFDKDPESTTYMREMQAEVSAR